jgi:DNA polymerase
VKRASSYERWRARARGLLARNIPPERAHWDDAGLFAEADQAPPVTIATAHRVPSRAVDLLERVACHRDPRRFAAMYRLLWRLTHGEHDLLDDAADDDVVALTRMARAVDRASHKMTAFARFREIRAGEDARYIAWFEPEHDVLARTAPFFVKRFGTMDWTIVTPDGGAHWDRRRLELFDVDASIALPPDDAAEALWLAYYESIFNPARLNVPLMRKEMPVGYWKNLPEAARIPSLVAGAAKRAGTMVETTLDRDVAPYVGMRCGSRDALATPEDVARATKPALDACRRCPLGANATQAVPGEGAAKARLMLVGEQPGDEEDLAGRPFVGPAGRLLRKALADAGIDVADAYVTNAVKHFSFEPRGKRRIHKTPAQREIDACRSWLETEIANVRPRVIVALGASALYGLQRERHKVGEARSAALMHASGARVVASYHPSAVLRAPDEAAQARLYAALVEDLRSAAALVGEESLPEDGRRPLGLHHPPRQRLDAREPLRIPRDPPQVDGDLHADPALRRMTEQLRDACGELGGEAAALLQQCTDRHRGNAQPRGEVALRDAQRRKHLLAEHRAGMAGFARRAACTPPYSASLRRAKALDRRPGTSASPTAARAPVIDPRRGAPGRAARRRR